jgi:hypothetical protein
MLISQFWKVQIQICLVVCLIYCLFCSLIIRYWIVLFRHILYLPISFLIIIRWNLLDFHVIQWQSIKLCWIQILIYIFLILSWIIRIVLFIIFWCCSYSSWNRLLRFFWLNSILQLICCCFFHKSYFALF